MGMTPDRYLYSLVEGNLEDYRAQPGNLRRAFNAVVAVSHLADTYFAYQSRHNPSSVSSFQNFGSFLEHLNEDTEGAFRDVRSIANVYKHLYTAPEYLAHATVLSGGALVEVRVDGDGSEIAELDADYEDGQDGSYGREFVRFTRKDGSEEELLPTLEKVLKYWYQEYAFQTPGV